MTAYRYRALNTEGKLVRGVLEGDSERQVRSQLRGQSMRPVDVTEANRQSQGGSSWQLLNQRRRISAGDLAMVTRQLATLVQSNLPLDECLQAAADQSRKNRLKGLERGRKKTGITPYDPGRSKPGQRGTFSLKHPQHAARKHSEKMHK